MPEKDAALLARSAAALRAEGKVAEADRLDAAVARIRREEGVAAGTTPAADLSGIRAGTFRVRDGIDGAGGGEGGEHPVPRPPRRPAADQP